MSAAQQQQRTAKQAGLLGQIRVNAEYAEQDAHAMAQQMFNRELEQITEAQGWQLISAVNEWREKKMSTPFNVRGYLNDGRSFDRSLLGTRGTRTSAKFKPVMSVRIAKGQMMLTEMKKPCGSPCWTS